MMWVFFQSIWCSSIVFEKMLHEYLILRLYDDLVAQRGNTVEGVVLGAFWVLGRLLELRNVGRN